jgi:hypothetical protein
MRTFTEHEKRTIRRAAWAIGIYLVLFCGFKAWKVFDRQRAEYGNLVKEAVALRQKIEPYHDKVATLKTMMENYHLDPAKLSRATIVGEASSAIQKAAASSGIQVGPVRESPARASARELASVSFEGTGPVPAVTALLNRMETLGYPLIIDSVQITPDARGPGGRVKVNLIVIILDFEQWKNEEAPHA